MLETINARAASAGDVLISASRQLWLASLGAAVVTREWAGKEAGGMFRTLVREGTAVESRAFRFVGDRLDTSFNQANTLWKRARRTVASTVRTYADGAATLVRDRLPMELPRPIAPARRVAKTKRAVKHARKPSNARATSRRTVRAKSAKRA
jgi:hypothetical protein